MEGWTRTVGDEAAGGRRLVPFGSFYSSKRVLVTGDTGFKGSWLSEWLDLLGAEVHGISLEPDTDPALYETLGLGDKISHHTVDSCTERRSSPPRHMIEPL